MGALRPQCVSSEEYHSQLERQLHGNLEVTMIVEGITIAAFHGSNDWIPVSIGRQRADICSAHSEPEYVEVLVIRQIKELSAQLQAHSLRDLEVLVYTEVQVPVSRPNKRVAAHHV